MRIRTVSSSTANFEVTDAVLKCNCAANAISVNLSASKLYPDEITIKKVDTTENEVTIVPNGSETIDGESSITLSESNEKKTLVPVDGGWAVVSDGQTHIVAAPTHSGGESFQTVEADLNLDAAAGSADGADPSFLGGVMGNVLAADMTGDANYLGGVIGHYNVTGTKATTYPAGALLAGIGDGVTEADGAVVAYIDGDSAQTNAGAAFKVRHNNSTAGSGFDYGLDLYDEAHDGFNAVSYVVSDQRLSNGTHIYSGTAATRAAVRALVGDSAPQGSLFVGESGVATTKPNLYVKVLDNGDDNDWERIVTQASD